MDEKKIIVTDEELEEIRLICSSLVSLDEHVEKQIMARAKLFQQKTEWWDKAADTYGLDTTNCNFTMNTKTGELNEKKEKTTQPPSKLTANSGGQENEG